MDKIMKSILIMLFFVVLNLQAKVLTDSLKVIDLQEVIVKGDARTDPTLTIETIFLPDRKRCWPQSLERQIFQDVHRGRLALA